MPATNPSVRSGRLPRPSLAGVGLFIVCLAYGSGPALGEVHLRLDPKLVVGPKACGECHTASIAVWKKTLHARTFKELPRRKSAKTIAKRMGLRRIKAASDCLTCHFTSQVRKQRVRPIAGVACESCHGAGKNWTDIHSDFGGKDVTAKTETPAHRKARYEKSVAAGLLRPSNLYAVAANCYSCHTIPNEKLVNVGGHSAGSKFELVSWSQGEVRHNVWYTKENRPASADRKRLMFILGKALDLEFALRGVAKATQRKKYAVLMARRAAAATKDLKNIAALVPTPEIETILKIAAQAKLKLNNEKRLLQAADLIAAAAKKLAGGYDGSTFSAVDPLIPKPESYKGRPSN